MRFLLVLILFIPSLSIAAPLVTGVSGTVTHGQSITVSGSGFGTKSTAAPNLWDTVENQYTLSNGTTIPVGGSNPWGVNYGSASTYRTTIGDQRGKSTANYYAANSTKNAFGTRQIPGATYLYASWWYKTAVAVPSSGHSSKYFRASDYDNVAQRTFSWTWQQAYTFENGTYYGNTWVTYRPAIDVWHFYEVWIDSVNERYTTAVDGTVIYNNIDWSGASVTVIDDIDCIGFDGNEPITETTSWLDDIYIDTTQQRVMICSGSTWSSRGHCEIQIPSAWSDTSATITVNQGSFADSSSAYLYVVDAAGASGRLTAQVTFGAGSSSTGSLRPGVSASGVTFR